MDKRLWFVALGALAVAGCKSDTVMGDRYYVPAAESDPTPIVAPAQKAVVAEEKAVTLPTVPDEKTDIKVAEYAPMTGVKSSGGVDSAAVVSAKGGVYVVQKGDTLGKIARKNGVKLADLMAANNLSERDAKRLQVGKKLTIPNGKVAATAKSKKADKKADGKLTTASAAPAALDSDGRYVVQSGDTPEKIARKNQVKLADLMKANGLDNDSAKRLQIGDKLIIPGKGGAAPVAATEAQPAASTEEAKTSPDLVTTTTTEVDVQPTTTPGTEVSTSPVWVEEESISIEDFAKKHNTTVEFIRANSTDLEGKTELKRGDLVFVPKAN